MMKALINLILILVVVETLYSQNVDNQNTFLRKGFTFGFSVGAGILSLSTNDTLNTVFTATLPNLRIGYMTNERLALQILLPGSPYQYSGKSRGFEGILCSGQYWLQKKWWILGGVGITLDAPAFWTMKNPDEENFYTGFPAIALATGFEIWQRKNFAIDMQYRIYTGQVKLENNGKKRGLSNMLSMGLNWY